MSKRISLTYIPCSCRAYIVQRSILWLLASRSLDNMMLLANTNPHNRYRLLFSRKVPNQIILYEPNNDCLFLCEDPRWWPIFCQLHSNYWSFQQNLEIFSSPKWNIFYYQCFSKIFPRIYLNICFDHFDHASYSDISITGCYTSIADVSFIWAPESSSLLRVVTTGHDGPKRARANFLTCCAFTHNKCSSAKISAS